MNLPTDQTPTFYDPQSKSIQTFAACRNMEEYDPEKTSIHWHRGSGADYLKQEPHLLLLPFCEALKLKEEAEAKRYEKGKAQEITKERFWEMLEVLPPEKWTNWSTNESFRLSECLSGTLYSFFVRVHDGDFSTHKNRYFEIVADAWAEHKELVEAVKTQHDIRSL